MEDLNVDRTLESITRLALARSLGSRTQAAKLLGVSIRTLRNWIRKYKLTNSYPPSFGKNSHDEKK